MLTPEEFLSQQEKFHFDAEGKPISWGIEGEVLRWIGERLPAGSKTLETGAGISTLYFALKGFEHIAITPDGRELENIRRYCEGRGVSLADVQLIQARSELYLPQAKLPDLDLVLVDGRHAFPTPYIDWFYAAISLKVSGLMVIDDTQLLTGRVLEDFLRADPHWEPVEFFPKTAVFKKLNERIHEEEWNQQPYMNPP